MQGGRPAKTLHLLLRDNSTIRRWLSFLGVIYLPIAVSQYRHNKQVSEKAIRDYLKWVSDQRE